MVPKLIENC